LNELYDLHKKELSEKWTENYSDSFYLKNNIHEWEDRMIKWNHILDLQPEDGRSIIQVDSPYQGHYTMGMRVYNQYGSFQEVLDHAEKYGWPKPDFWWVYAEDFPFPKDKLDFNEVKNETL
jgi:hypothetical protein